MNAVRVKRRVPELNMDKRPIPGKFREVIEEASYIKKTARGHMIQLSNGSIIYRKDRDVVLS